MQELRQVEWHAKIADGAPEHAAVLILLPGLIDKCLDEIGRRSEESY